MIEKFDVRGMSCSACSAAVERAMKKLNGVNSVSVSLLANEMTLDYDEKILSRRAICLAVKKAGYGASPRDAKNASDRSTRNTSVDADECFTPVRTRLIVSLCFLLPLMYISMGNMLGLPQPPFLRGEQNCGVLAFAELLLCLPVVYVNRKFYTAGFGALFRGSPNMDSLVASGSSASLIYGIAALFIIIGSLGRGDFSTALKYSHDLYFESAAMILTLVTVGKLLESRSKDRTNEAVRRLISLAPEEASVERDGKEIKIKTSEIIVGDIVILRAGERAPVDGTVIGGSAQFDESALTGESMPVDKAEGGNIMSASVDLSGTVRFRALRVGEQTTLAQITELVRGASSSKAPIARIADRVAGVFVPVVMGIAVFTAIIWLIAGYGIEFALSRAVAVLVISCPCALGLATPVAVTAAAGRCASKGILVKSAAALEALSSVDTVVFDKTGTLTAGKPQITSYAAAGGIEENELFASALALEENSLHPLAAAAVMACREKLGEDNGFKVTDYRETAGRGICGKYKEHTLIGGSAAYMSENGVSLDGIEGGHYGTPMYFARDGVLLGVLYASDRVRESSANAITALHGMNVGTVMLTGDTEENAKVIADEIGIEQVIAGVLPDKKAEAVGALRMNGKRVAMVGDGINDSPALASADVGIAVGAGSDIAIDSAGIVLMKSDMNDAAEALGFSRIAMRNIRQNLFWAFFYNSICIPLAAGALYIPFGITLSPMIAAAAMSCSSIFVVTNALRLYRK